MTLVATTAGLAAGAFTVFALGLRHGADPDHLAAIDNLTRNSAGLGSRLSRFCGTLFAGGHSVMVLSIAALAGLLGSRIAAHGALLETIGMWVSIITLFAIAALNIRQLAAGRVGPAAGFKTALLPKSLRAATSPLAAIPIGLLFGLGFDTSSQVATYALALTNGGGVLAGLLIGLVFSAGMAVTDTLDSVLVHKLCTRHPLELVRATRVWIIAVTALALLVGNYELAQALGWSSPLPDLAMSGILVGALLCVFIWTYAWSSNSARYREPGITSPVGRKGAAVVPVEESFMIRKSLGIAGAGAATAALVGALLLYGVHTSRGSDHQDSPTVVNRPGADITDVFVFPAPDNDNNVVLVMDVYPLIPAGQGPSTFFDPAVLYQFKIDNVGDHQEHLVIQFLASPSSSGTQTIGVYGPTAPRSTGTNSTLATLSGVINYNDANATINGGGIKVFAGPREDPFFFDLARFFQIIPDRNYANQPSPPAPTASSFRGFPNSGNFTSCDHTASQDFLSANQFNVLSFVVELPRTALAPNGGAPGKIGVWATTSTTTGS